MKNSNKKGFTIVELVIVIAVIAILAAVLIPTFSGLVKKANLSSDMQAVREINQALAADQAKNGIPKNVDKAMAVIAAAGYDIASYKPLSSNLQIYWVDTVNRVILCEKGTGKVVYPEDYVEITNDGSWHLFNESFRNAISMDISVTVDPAKDFTSGNTYTKVVAGSTEVGSRLEVTFTKNSDATISSPTYTIVKPASYQKDTEGGNEAEKQAGKYLYTLAAQISERLIKGADGKTAEEVNIVLPSDMDIDVSNYIWKPIRNFKGDITAVDGKQAVIKGLSLDKDLSYVDSVMFDGKSSAKIDGKIVSIPSKYNVVGFIANVIDGTVENLTFKDINIETPCFDYEAYLDNTGKNGSGANANVFGIIGSITPDFSISKNYRTPAKVTISNIKLEGGSVKGLARVGGIVGYIGGADLNELPTGSEIKIDGCTVSNVSFTAGMTSSSYGSLGGIVSYIARCESNTKLNISDCTISNNTFYGVAVGAICGWNNNAGADITIENCTISNNTLQHSDASPSYYHLGIIAGRNDKKSITVDEATLNAAASNVLKDKEGHTKIGELKYTTDTNTKGNIVGDAGIKVEGKTTGSYTLGNYSYTIDEEGDLKGYLTRTDK